MIIGIHEHLTPPRAAGRFPMPPSLTDVDGMLAARADAGINLTIIGSPVGAGATKIMFGADSPPLGRPLKQMLDAVRALPIDDGSKARILGGNAAEVFGLGAAGRVPLMSGARPVGGEV